MADDAPARRPDLTRRAFLTAAAGASAASALAGCAPTSLAAPRAAAAVDDPPTAGAVPVTLRVNGKEQRIRVDPRTTLLDCLRETLLLTGTKKGCDHGQCGACTVHVSGRRVNSCLSLAVMHDGEEITTIEGLGMSAVALLGEPCGPEDADVKELMSGNICRCGAYPNIVAAIQRVRRGA